MLAVVAALIVVPVARLEVRASLNYNEGWNAYHSKAMWEGSDVYPSRDSLVTNNYPPLSFAIVGLAGLWTRDLVVAGRMLSLGSMLAVAGLIGLIVGHVTRSADVAGFAAALFLAYCLLHFEMYVAMNDPSWLAHAMALLAFASLVIGRSPLSASLSGLVAAAALFTKHSVVPLPLTMAIWAVASLDNRRARVWMGCFAATLIALFVSATALWGRDFWQGVFMTPRDVSVWYLAPKLAEFLVPMAPIAVVSLIVARPANGSDPGLCRLYLAVALAWASLMLAGDGVSYNAVFDVLIALSLLIGPAAGAPAMSALRLRGAVALALALSPAVPVALLRAYGDLHGLRTVQELSEKQIALLASAPGPAACETLALCYWAGQPMAIDFFNTAQKIEAGVVPAAALACAFEAGRFGRLELASASPGYGGFPDRINAAIAAGYEPELVAPYRVVYRPSGLPPSSECASAGVLR